VVVIMNVTSMTSVSEWFESDVWLFVVVKERGRIRTNRTVILLTCRPLPPACTLWPSAVVHATDGQDVPGVLHWRSLHSIVCSSILAAKPMIMVSE